MRVRLGVPAHVVGEDDRGATQGFGERGGERSFAAGRIGRWLTRLFGLTRAGAAREQQEIDIAWHRTFDGVDERRDPVDPHPSAAGRPLRVEAKCLADAVGEDRNRLDLGLRNVRGHPVRRPGLEPLAFAVGQSTQRSVHRDDDLRQITAVVDRNRHPQRHGRRPLGRTGDSQRAVGLCEVGGRSGEFGVVIEPCLVRLIYCQ